MTSQTKKRNPQKEYLFKENTSGRRISEIETFHAICYRLLLGERHPKINSIYNKKDGKLLGTMSRKIPGYQSLQDFLKANQGESKLSLQTKLLEAEVVKIWAAAYMEDEYDLRADNYGFDRSGYCVKIGSEQATWKLTSKYRSIDANTAEPAMGHILAPAAVFRVTKRDIEVFPIFE